MRSFGFSLLFFGLSLAVFAASLLYTFAPRTFSKLVAKVSFADTWSTVTRDPVGGSPIGQRIAGIVMICLASRMVYVAVLGLLHGGAIIYEGSNAPLAAYSPIPTASGAAVALALGGYLLAKPAAIVAVTRRSLPDRVPPADFVRGARLGGRIMGALFVLTGICLLYMTIVRLAR